MVTLEIGLQYLEIMDSKENKHTFIFRFFDLADFRTFCLCGNPDYEEALTEFTKQIFAQKPDSPNDTVKSKWISAMQRIIKSNKLLDTAKTEKKG